LYKVAIDTLDVCDGDDRSDVNDNNEYDKVNGINDDASKNNMILFNSIVL
jgi:hypothetical protein